MSLNYNITFAKVNKVHKICIKSNNKINKLAKNYNRWYIDNQIMSMIFCKISIKHIQDNK